MRQKSKTKKPLFDPRLPGAKMIFYGAILLFVAGAINLFYSWVLAILPYGSDMEMNAVFMDALIMCLQVAVVFLVAVDAINNRNRPSKAAGIMIKAFCAFAIAVIFILQIQNFEGYVPGIIASGITIAGSFIISLGAFRNAKVAGKKKK